MRFPVSFFQGTKRRRFWLLPSLLILSLLMLVGFQSYVTPSGVAQTNSNDKNRPEEQILSYQSEIVVNENASLEVAETITVNATGDEIQRGIYRDFPLDAPFQPGEVSFNVVDVLRNGDSTYHWVEQKGDYERINIYHPDVELDPGNYTYTIQYETSRQLDFSEADTDRLYWNVTGQEWSFPINQVRAKVFLPEEVPEESLQLNAFTGREGREGQSYQARIDAGGNPTFATTSPLEAQEGLSVIVEFPTGYVERPGFLESVYYALRSGLTSFLEGLISIFPVLILLGFFLVLTLGIFSGANTNSSQRSGRRGGGGGFGGGAGGAGGGGAGGGGGGAGGGGGGGGGGGA